jgi:hypothetical protein
MADDTQKCFEKTLSFRDYTINVVSSPNGDWYPSSPCVEQAYRVAVSKQGRVITESHPIESEPVEDAWVTDLDGDDSFELLVVSAGGSGSYGDIELYALGAADTLVASSLPPLSKEEEVGYGGGDQFAIEGDRLVRTFTRYLESDANCCPSGDLRRIEYEYVNGRLEAFTQPHFFSFRPIAIAFIAQFVCVGLMVQCQKRRMVAGEVAVLLLAVVAAIYCIAAGIHLHDGWQEMMAFSDQSNEFSQEGSARVRRGGIFLLAMRYWPYMLIGIGVYVGYNSLRLLRRLHMERRRI